MKSWWNAWHMMFVCLMEWFEGEKGLKGWTWMDKLLIKYFCTTVKISWSRGGFHCCQQIIFFICFQLVAKHFRNMKFPGGATLFNSFRKIPDFVKKNSTLSIENLSKILMFRYPLGYPLGWSYCLLSIESRMELVTFTENRNNC